jgi:hypothetical protein
VIEKVLNRQIHPIAGNPSLCEFFRLLATGEISPEIFINNNYHDFLLKAKVGNSLKDEFVNVNIQCELNEILQTFGNLFYLNYKYQKTIKYQPPI